MNNVFNVLSKRSFNPLYVKLYTKMNVTQSCMKKCRSIRFLHCGIGLKLIKGFVSEGKCGKPKTLSISPYLRTKRDGNTDICKKRNEWAAALLPLAFRGTLQHILRPQLLKRVIAAINYFTEIHTLFSCIHAHSYRPNFRIAPLCSSISCRNQIKIIYFLYRRQMNIVNKLISLLTYRAYDIYVSYACSLFSNQSTNCFNAYREFQQKYIPFRSSDSRVSPCAKGRLSDDEVETSRAFNSTNVRDITATTIHLTDPRTRRYHPRFHPRVLEHAPTDLERRGTKRARARGVSTKLMLLFY